MWSACKVLDQNIFDVMISASIGVFNSDQLKIMILADLVFLAIAFFDGLIFKVLLAVKFDCQNRIFHP